MSIAINQSKCVGCGRCSQVCPGTLIGMDSDGKACMLYPKDCWGCCSCIKECKVDAIALYLGADMGGMGSKMSVASREQRSSDYCKRLYRETGWQRRNHRY